MPPFRRTCALLLGALLFAIPGAMAAPDDAAYLFDDSADATDDTTHVPDGTATAQEESQETTRNAVQAFDDSAFAALWERAAAALSADEAEMAAAADALRAFALTDPDARRAGQSWFRVGELAERRSAFPEAADGYRRSLEQDPHGRYARRATMRLQSLEPRLESDAHQTFYGELDRVRRQYAQLDREEALARMRALVEQAPDREARIELKFWLGNEHGEVRGEPAIGWEWYRRIIATEGLTPGQYYRAFNNMVMLAPQGGLIIQTASEMERFMRAYPDIAEAADLEALRVHALPMSFRRWMNAAAMIGLVLAGAVFLRRRAWRAFPDLLRGSWRPWPSLLVLAWAVVGAAIIAELYEPGYLHPYLRLLPPLALLSLAWGAIGRCAPREVGRPTRIFLAFTASLSTIGCVWFVLSAHNLHAVMGF